MAKKKILRSLKVVPYPDDEWAVFVDGETKGPVIDDLYGKDGKAYAHLFAAAPDLLSVVEHLSKYVTSIDFLDTSDKAKLVTKLHNTIAKAKGRNRNG